MKKNIIIITIIIVVAVFVYYGFIKETPGSESLLNTSNSTTSEVLGKDISNALNKVGQLSLDTSIFSDPNFTILVDYKQTIPDQQPFRNNPFSPNIEQEPNSEGGFQINIVSPQRSVANPDDVDQGDDATGDEGESAQNISSETTTSETTATESAESTSNTAQ